MKQTIKRALSLALALALSVTILLPSAWAEGENEEPSITVFMTIYNQGVFAKDKDNQIMRQRSVAVYDTNHDGYYSLDEALVSVHTSYAQNEKSDYSFAYNESWGSYSVLKLWGVETSATGFYRNNQMTASVNEEYLSAGDQIVAFIYKDQETWSDRYSYFTENDKTVCANTEFELELKYSSIWGDTDSAQKAAPIGVYDEAGTYSVPAVFRGEKITDNFYMPTVSTDTDGKVKFSITEPGVYYVTAQHDSPNYITYTDTLGTVPNYLVPPLCTITVLSESNYANYEILEKAKTALTWKSMSSEPANAVTTAPDLPSTLSVDEKTVSVSWACDDSTYALSVSNYYGPWSAYVDRPASEDVSCTLTATLTYNAASETKTFPVTVKAEGVSDTKTAVVDYGTLLSAIAESYTTSSDPWTVMDMAAYNGSNVKSGYDSYASILGMELANAATKQSVSQAALDGVQPYQGYEMSTYPYLSLAYQAAGLDGTGDHSLSALKDAMVAYLNGSSYYSIDEMAPVIAALSSYYHSGDAAVITAVDKAIGWLSEQQNADGTFSNAGTPNSNTTAMAVIALSAIGIDAHTDSNFIKTSGNIRKSAVEGLLSFALTDCSGFGYKGNVTKNSLATEQSFRALVAYAKMKEKGSAYNIYLEAKNSTQAVSAPNITATVPVTETKPSEGKVTFTLVGDSTWISSTTVTLSNSVQTVGDVFETVLDSNHYTYIGLNSNYIRSITMPSGKTLAEFDGGKNSGWMYTVNGEFPQIGLNDCYLTNGDSVRFFYTYDYTVDSPAKPTETPVTTTTTVNSDGTITVTVTQGKETLDNVSGGVKVELSNKGGAGDVVVLVNKDGSETIVTKSLVEDETVYALLDGTCTVKIIDNAKDFSDISDTAWYADAVDFVSGHELYNGTGNGAFSPNAPMSRAMLATVLYRLESEPESASDILAGFNDGADVSAWAQEGLSWAVANKVLEGTDGNCLAPNETVTREQLAVIIYRYAKLCGMDMTVSASTDISGQGVSSWAETAMAWAVENGIIEGGTGGKLNPQGPASRAEVAAILQRLVAVMVK